MYYLQDLTVIERGAVIIGTEMAKTHDQPTVLDELRRIALETGGLLRHIATLTGND